MMVYLKSISASLVCSDLSLDNDKVSLWLRVTATVMQRFPFSRIDKALKTRPSMSQIEQLIVEIFWYNIDFALGLLHLLFSF